MKKVMLVLFIVTTEYNNELSTNFGINKNVLRFKHLKCTTWSKDNDDTF